MKPTQTIRDAAILVALILLAASVRVTALPEVPFAGPPAHAAVEQPEAPPEPQPAAQVLPPTDDTGAKPECTQHRRLTVRDGADGEVVVIDVNIDPRLQAALGLCRVADDDPAAGPAAKA